MKEVVIFKGYLQLISCKILCDLHNVVWITLNLVFMPILGFLIFINPIIKRRLENEEFG
jgi:hypothetical protein